jgi:hypothetical protein
MTREHIWPQWISKLLLAPTGAQHVQHELRRWGRSERRWSKRVLDATIRAVCKQCNEGWLSTLEDKVAKPILEPLILGDSRLLTPADCMAIARWVYKMALCFEFADGDRDDPVFFSEAERHEFKTAQQLPNVSIWAGRCASDRAAFVKSVIRAIIDYRDNRRYRLIATTLTVGQLAIQVVAMRNDAGRLMRPNQLDKFEPRSHWQDHLVALCPASDSAIRTSEKQILVDDDIAALMLRWNGSGEP